MFICLLNLNCGLSALPERDKSEVSIEESSHQIILPRYILAYKLCYTLQISLPLPAL